MNKIDWNEQMKRLLKSELVRRGVSHEKLVLLLAKLGVHETKASIDSKISRGTFSAVFLIQCLNSIGCKSFQPDITTEFIKICPEVRKSKSDKGVNSNLLTYINKKTSVHYLDIVDNQDTNTNGLPLTVVSLFSGAGGLDIGLEQAGFQTVVCVENDINCRATLRFNRPEWTLFESSVRKINGKLKQRIPGDIRDIGTNEVLELASLRKGDVTLVAGGAPCQPFSNIGKRDGTNDETNGDLFLEFVRMVKGISPKAFIFENVAGITHEKHTEVLEYMSDKFDKLGYNISHSILNAANYGVAQRRERFFLIGIKGFGPPAFPLPTHYKDKRAWDGFIKAFDRKPESVPLKWVTLGEVLKQIPKNSRARKDFALMKISDKVVERMKYIKQGQNFKVLPMTLRPECWKTGKHQGNDTFGRLIKNLPSITIRTAAYNPAKGMYIHPTENRGLSTIEMASIQSFPVDWIFKCHDREYITLVSGGKQIGNAVPPLLAKALGIAIKKQLQFKASKS